ncbi:hypothetical protein [Dyella caseinilytica]|uniref:Uncharacterized protein n=1 Tax=Dyella caseinilytica TaxID=1849581 RepID=A0ABX7GPM5_9GAMM|nr:hypothetical protein [Dyella caseinilytica]QRN52375.1 hypothetical protein ISN74_12890 [Dyella caseinilytica]GGA05402.1 hypothetical protein GCM10011408_27930 [Dyella caseinilytica]
MSKRLSRPNVLLRLSLFAALVVCAVMVHAQSAPAKHVAGFGLPVPNEKLDVVRGGFDLGDGLEASLGIQRAVYIDGNLVTYASVNIPDLAHVTTQQAMALASALSTVNVQSGQGNTFDPSSLGNTTAATVIQNTLNNQTIRSLTTLNVAVNTLNAFRDEGMQQALQAAQVQALGH